MKILIIDIDSQLPNLALKKIEKYHLNKGDEIIWNFELYANKVDFKYISCLFEENKKKAENWEDHKNCLIGGTGYSLDIELPPEIERIKPKINMGFTTRGCIRNKRSCPWCVVPEKEGGIYRVGNIYDLWDGTNEEIIILDNNILADPVWFFHITKQIKEEGLIVDFNQGLDFRLLDEEILIRLKEIKTKQIRFAFDRIEYEQVVLKKIELLKEYKVQALWYVLVGYEEEEKFTEDLYRIELLIKNGQRAYCMKHKNAKDDKRYTALDRWCNSPLLGMGTIPFKDFLNNTKDGLVYKKYFE